MCLYLGQIPDHHVSFLPGRISVGVLLLVTSKQSCAPTLTAQNNALTGMIQQVLVDLIQCAQLYALYGRSKRVLIFILTLLAVCTLGGIALLGAVELHSKGRLTITLPYVVC